MEYLLYLDSTAADVLKFMDLGIYKEYDSWRCAVCSI
jgi:hypothetical protein